MRQKSLLVLAEILCDINVHTLGGFKYPWTLAGWKMTAFIFYPESRTHHGVDILPPSILQDRCGQSWLSRATCVLLLSSPMNVKSETSCAIFRWNRKRALRIAYAFIVEMLWRIPDGFLLEELVRFYAPPASTRGAETAPDSAAVAASVAAPHREGRPRRHAPHWLVKATSRRWGGQKRG